jgi:uncharacterized protein (UPF0264 family)
MPVPRLLVSVRNAVEAKALHGSGCAILDVKEPDNGALGMADAATISRIAECVSADQQMSIALGEVHEFKDCGTVPARVSYLKLGLAGLNRFDDWQRRWLDVRECAEARCSGTVDWVAVMYADHAVAESPVPDAVVDAAIATGCRVVLVDTFKKRAGCSLFDSLSITELVELKRRSQTAGLEFAIAGQLRVEHGSAIMDIEPDIVGIRGAACLQSDRRSRIDRACVSAFCQSLAAVRTP